MLKSMTGFGRYETADEKRKLIVEIKTVNHRYCEIGVRMPRKFVMFETAIRSLLKNYISRGKADLFVTYEEYKKTDACVKYNEEIAKEYMRHLKSMGEAFLLENDVTICKLARFPEVLTLEEKSTDEEALWNMLKDTVEKAAEKLLEARTSEGKHLEKDILSKLDGLLPLISYIEERSPQILAEYREKLKLKVEELLGDSGMDEAVMATELIMYADKICVDEETVRLRAHIENMRSTFSQADNIGRKLDFIVQEMNREANTVLSKANDIEVSNRAIDLKTEIEKIREQIQNIE